LPFSFCGLQVTEIGYRLISQGWYGQGGHAGKRIEIRAVCGIEMIHNMEQPPVFVACLNTGDKKL